MAIDSNRLALTFACATAVLWVVCSALVAVAPDAMMSVMGHMSHANLTDLDWTLTWSGFLIGLVGWVVWAGAAGWLIGWIYCRLSKDDNA
jgi:hypothetical protein